MSEPDVAAVGALLSDRARCRILQALGDGRALPASRLAGEAGVSAATASSHLHKLVDGGLLTVRAHGRHRYYRIADARVGDLLETLQQFAPARPVTSLRAGTRANAMRRARSCYDHLAGQLGVAVMDGLLRRGYLASNASGAHDDPPVGTGSDVDYTLTDVGRGFLAEVRVPPGTVRYCVDWSEQRPHLAGGLGRGLLTRFDELGWIVRRSDSRAVTVTDAGRRGLRDQFGADLP